MGNKVFNTDQRITLGIWGLGRGQNFIHSARALNIDVVAGCDKNAAMREAFAKNAPDAYITDNEDDFLARDFDAVLIATYFPDHAKHAIKALEAGKHVLCEVTSFQTPAEGVRLVEAVEKSGKIYHLLENYPFMKDNMHLKKLWDDGFFGEFIYGEYEYVHCARQLAYAYNFYVDGKNLPVEPGWAVHNWRAALNPHSYNTHSLGPLMVITGLRPVAVEAFPNSVAMPGGLIIGDKPAKSSGASLVRMSNGGVMRNLMGSMTMDNHTGGRLGGTKAGADKMTRGHLRLCIGADGEGPKFEVKTEWPDAELGELCESAGHGGGDFWELYYFAREMLTGEKGPWGIYSACDVTLAGILAGRSARRNGEPQRIPDFRLKADRDAYRDDDGADIPHFDAENGCFPPDADREVVKDFNRVMRDLFHNNGLLRDVFAALQGMQIYDTLVDRADQFEVVKCVGRLRGSLPEIAEVCRKAERIAEAYPDSVGGRTIRYGLSNAPLDKIYNYDKTIGELDAWLDGVMQNGQG